MGVVIGLRNVPGDSQPVVIPNREHQTWIGRKFYSPGGISEPKPSNFKIYGSLDLSIYGEVKSTDLLRKSVRVRRQDRLL